MVNRALGATACNSSEGFPLVQMTLKGESSLQLPHQSGTSTVSRTQLVNHEVLTKYPNIESADSIMYLNLSYFINFLVGFPRSNKNAVFVTGPSIWCIRQKRRGVCFEW